MLCPKCNNTVNESDEFCSHCGTQLNTKKDTNLNMLHHLKNNKIYIALIGVIAVVVVAAIFMFTGKTVNLDDYLTVEFSGWDGYGKAKTEVNYDKFIDDYATKIEYTDDYYMTSAHAVDAFKHYMRVKTDESYNLSNGDVVTVTWNISEEDVREIEKRFNYKVKFSKSIEYKVKDLPAVEEIDPFTTVSLECSGINGQGKADVKDNDSRFEFKLSTDEKLTNGQMITATLAREPEYYAANYGVKPTMTERSFVVHGLSESLTDFSKVNETDLQSMVDMGVAYVNKKYFTADVNGNQENFCEELTYCGTLHFPSSDYTNNYAITLFKIKGKLTKEGYETKTYTFYHPVLFTNLVLNNDGSVDFKQNAYAPRMEHLGRVSIKKLTDENVLEVVYLDGFKTLEDAKNYYGGTWYPAK